MKIAIIADIHGNSMLLDAVLADIDAQGGVDGYWVLGDLVMLGHDPAGVINRLHALPNARFIRGNTDRSLCSPIQYLEEDADDVKAKRVNGYVRWYAVHGWTLAHVQSTGHLEWLTNLPVEFRETLPDGTSVLCVHASPGSDDSPGFHPRYPEEEMVQRMRNAEADLVFVGHTHFPMNREMAGVHLVNVSPVNIPFGEDLRAKYVILEADQDSYTTQHRYVEYDLTELQQAIKASGHPAQQMLLDFSEGANSYPWPDHIKDPLALMPKQNHKYGKI